MDNSKAEELLDEAQTQFSKEGKIEEGLDVEKSEIVQLRKGCRLIEASKFLKEEKGYYTVIIEASFEAIERTIQFYLLEKDMITEEEYINHEKIYEEGVNAGLYSKKFKQKLEELWRNNRSDTYYREAKATEKRSQKMLELAEEIHRHITNLSQNKHKCICKD
jgi:hypothetical protein